MTQTTPALLPAGTRAVVTVDIPDTWIGLVPAGTVVTIVEIDGLDDGEDYAAELADGRAVSFAASELAPAVPGRFATAPRAESHGGFVHTCNPGVITGLPFGRKDTEHCARCWEMVEQNAPARADHVSHRRNPAAEDAARSADLRAHFASDRHRSGRCGIVCTYGDW